MGKRLVQNIEKIADKLGEWAAWLVVAMFSLVLIEVFMRYVLNKPLMVADEISALMLVAMTYLGAAYAFRQGQHVRITAFVKRLPPKVSSWLRVVTLTLVLSLSIILAISSYELMAFSFKMNLSSETWLRIPLRWPQLTIPIGFTLMSIVLVLEIVNAVIKIKSKRSVEELEQ